MIPVNEPLLDGNEKKYLEECIDTGWISSEGPFVKKFEEEFSKRAGRKFGIAVCNGTAALEAAVIAAGIGKGDEVIMPAFTIISCASAVIRAGGMPVLVDSDPETWNMDVGQIEDKITSRTKAIMAVHIYGLPVDMEPLQKLALKYELKIIEDAAELIGQTYNGKQCGSFGDVSTFSFYPNKHITTGEGGMILTDDVETAERCRSLRNLCFQSGKRFVHDELGFNFRMTNLQAALGMAQFERLDEFIEKKRHIGKMYNEGLKDLKSIRLPLEKTEYSDNIYWVYGIVIKKETGINAVKAMKKLADQKIGTRPFFYPMHLQPVFKKMDLFVNENYPVSEELSEMGFYIPSGLAISNDQIDRTIGSIRAIFKN
ncbi:MAG TPA: DegT/DnrJ/EryC1/StrS family aminotransferase [Ignavibacteria bacterium]|nr:DegT/DnrJ/EryC1/StrS family aminotransferase [Ignavibacteria bacterium]HMR38831.1 DegT/DnrJ/EryC1/StrS family aminotransferase [Ignavibacteria bacterium]